MRNFPIIDILWELPPYLILRSKQVKIILSVIWLGIYKSASSIKTAIVSRLFWGRGSGYRNFLHLIVFFISAVSLFTGIVGKIRAAQSSYLDIDSGTEIDLDLLQQGSSLSAVVGIDPNQEGYQFRVRKHIVQRGDTVKSIAEKYDILPNTVRWANIEKIGPFSNNVEVGWDLTIPGADGILYEVKKGESIVQIVKRTNSSLFEVGEINDLQPPNYKVRPGQRIFIPNNEGYLWDGEIDDSMLRNAFLDPLSHPDCTGYRIYSEFNSRHNGLDLAKGSGCPIRAIAAGEVTHAGWWGGGAGWTVIVDHGGGIVSHSYHGNGKIWVKKGDWVKAGQDLLYMGNTGNSTGTHLHFSLFKDGIAIDPLPYVPVTLIYPWD